DDSYFQSKPPECQKYFNSVCADIQKLRGDRGTTNIRENPLWESETINEPGDGSLSETTLLKRLQALREEKSTARRLVLGYRYLSLVLTMAREAFAKAADNQAFLLDLSPESIRVIGTQFVANAVTHPTREQYQKSLLSGDLEFVQNGIYNSFTPPALRYMGANARIVSQEQTKRGFSIRFGYSESHPLWHSLRRGDYVRSLGTNTPACLFSVESVAGDRAEVRSAMPAEITTECGLPERVLFIKAKRPLEYYLSMIGIYIQHFFFDWSPPGLPVVTPATVWLIE